MRKWEILIEKPFFGPIRRAGLLRLPADDGQQVDPGRWMASAAVQRLGVADQRPPPGEPVVLPPDVLPPVVPPPWEFPLVVPPAVVLPPGEMPNSSERNCSSICSNIISSMSNCSKSLLLPPRAANSSRSKRSKNSS